MIKLVCALLLLGIFSGTAYAANSQVSFVLPEGGFPLGLENLKWDSVVIPATTADVDYILRNVLGCDEILAADVYSKPQHTPTDSPSGNITWTAQCPQPYVIKGGVTKYPWHLYSPFHSEIRIYNQSGKMLRAFKFSDGNLRNLTLFKNPDDNFQFHIAK